VKMGRTKNKLLPVFIPHEGCPCRCIFCDQRQITKSQEQDNITPAPEDVQALIAAWTLPEKPEIAFYGGSFTALPEARQKSFLRVAYAALLKGKISAIRLSTRPDAVENQELALLRAYGVSTVELGVQSMEDAVLLKANRGHDAATSLRAVRRLKEAGFKVGVQLLPGLPGETTGSAFQGAARILLLKPDMLRIYPAIVLAGTELGSMYQRGEYQPLSIDDAIQRSVVIATVAAFWGVPVIRTGLQPTEELSCGSSVLAGPYHPAFGHLVAGEFWRLKAEYLLTKAKGQNLFVNWREFAALVGQNAVNKKYLADKYGVGLKTAPLEPGVLAIGDKEPQHLLYQKDFINHLLMTWEEIYGKIAATGKTPIL